MKIDKDDLACLFAGFALGVGILGFIVVALVTHAVMPVWANVADFINFLMLCGWAAVIALYATSYVFVAVHIAWPFVKRVIIGEKR